MSFETIRRNQLEYVRAAGFPAAHGFSTRYGGVSTGPLSSLNLGFSRGDEPDNVRENWRRFGDAVGLPQRTWSSHARSMGIRCVS